MKRIPKVIALALSLGVALPLAAIVRAEDGHGRPPHMQMDPSKRVENMTKKYNLTPEQQDKIKAILEERKQKMEESRKNAEAAHKETRDQIRALLTEDQQKLFDADQAKMEAKMKDRRKEWKEKRAEKMESKDQK